MSLFASSSSSNPEDIPKKVHDYIDPTDIEFLG